MRRSALVVPPGPRSKVPGKLELQFFRDPLNFMREFSAYGDIAQARLFSRRVYVLSDPELIHQVLSADHRSFVKGRSMQEARRVLGDGLLTSDGDYHHSQRRLLQPALLRKPVEARGERMVELAERRVTRWSAGTLDMHLELSRLTLEIVADTLLSVDLEDDSEEIATSLTYAVAMIGRVTLPGAKLWEKSPEPSARRFRAAVRRLDRATEDILRRRRALTDDPDDAMTLLLSAQNGERALTDRQVRDEAITLLLAGHETTANLLTWTLYLLSLHPDVESRLRSELRTVVGDRPATVADAAKLHFAEQVLNETLRKYPPVWALGRIARHDYQLGGYTIPAGSVLSLNPWIMHHQPRFYPDPFAFDPDRWTPEAREARPRYSFFPFGGGPRVCMGSTFAMLEAKLVLATLLRHWRFTVEPGRRIVADPVLTLRPRNGLRMVLEPAPADVPTHAGNGKPQADLQGDFWDHAIGLWESGAQGLWRRHSDSVNGRLVARWLPRGLSRVLKTDLWDEAVGDGLYPTLSARAELAIGIDNSPGVVRAARDRHPGLEGEQADVRRLPFASESFDAAVSNSTLDHFDSTVDIVTALQELHRVLKPGGTLLITLDNPKNPFVALTRIVPRRWLNRFWLVHAEGASRVGQLPYYVGATVDRDRLQSLLDSAGFEVREVDAIVHAPRALATLAAALVERRGSPRAVDRFARVLEWFERLERTPLRFRTGHFTAVLATRR